MAKVYKKKEFLGNIPTPPPQTVAKFEEMEFRKGNSMIIHTPDFEPFEARIKFANEKWGGVTLEFSEKLLGLTAWIHLIMDPKGSLASRCTLAHCRLRIFFPFQRPGLSKHQFDITNYDNVIVTENEARVWGTKVELLPRVAERKIFNPKQLNIFQ